MSVRVSKAELIVKGFLQVVILKDSSKNMMKLLLIWELAGYGRLGLVQLG